MSNLRSLAEQGLSRIKSKVKPVATPAQDAAGKLSEAINKLRGRDKIGIVGDVAVVAGSAAAGVAVSGTVAGAAGATTLLGSTTLAAWLGGIFVTTTPVGWVVGSAAVAGIAGYSLTRLVRSGGWHDRIREQYSDILNTKLFAQHTSEGETDFAELEVLLGLAVANEAIEAAKADQILAFVKGGKLSEAIAVKRIMALPVLLSLPDDQSSGR